MLRGFEHFGYPCLYRFTFRQWIWDVCTEYRQIQNHPKRSNQKWGRKVLKQIRPSLKYTDEKSLTVLSVEARVATVIGAHPNLVDYYGIHVIGSTSFLVKIMSLVCLRTWFIYEKEILASVLHGITSGITHMHRKGSINKNITPNNGNGLENWLWILYSNYYEPIEK